MDSIAIIGLACRFPGEATSAERFWDVLCTHSHITRFNADGFHAAGQNKLNRSRTQEAHFLQQDIAAFDANFFSIHKAEAVAMDPQQRIMLEVAYESFENAGLPLEKVAGSNTSCHIGSFTADYREMTFRDTDHNASTYSNILVLRSPRAQLYAGKRLLIKFSCTSSRVPESSHGDTSTALVGGCNLLLNPDKFQVLSNGKFLADGGICKTFDGKGDGYGRGEGFAAITLKRVSDAVRDDDPIRAVIRGTGVNHDGKTKGLTVPSTDAQADLIRSVYKHASLDMADTLYIEAHGTGTKVGDPLELEGIFKTISSTRKEGDDIIVGSVKSNIGHLESAAGLAGLIKAVYILERGIIPPNVHFEHPNQNIPFKEWRLKVPTAVSSWPKQGRRRLSVQGFGYGGTNAHAILDDAFHFLQERELSGVHFTTVSSMTDPQPKTGTTSQTTKAHIDKDRVFVVSSQDKAGLRRQKSGIADYLESRNDDENEYALLRDLSFTLSEKRTRLPWSTYEVASSVDELVSRLQDDDSESPAVRCSPSPRIGFVFTGQGSQWAQMGIDLLQYKIFEESMKQSDSYIHDHLNSGWCLLDEICRDEAESKIDMPSFSQPICTALQIALVDLLESWRITPSAIVGHSSGEIAGAYCLGVLSKEDALSAAYYRGSLSESISTRAPGLEGGMMAVGLSLSETRSWVEKFGRMKIGIACVNSPSSVTLSGDLQAIGELEERLSHADIFARRLKVAIAYHSDHMDMIAEPYMHSMKDLRVLPGRKDRKMYSSVTGDLIDWSELGALNWVRNLISPVLFYDALLEVIRPTKPDGLRTEQNAVDVLVEVGPHTTLKSAVQETVNAHNIRNVKYVALLSKKRNGVRTALNAAGSLFAEGVRVSVFDVNDHTGDTSYGQPQLLVDLPTYSWDHTRRYWAESRLSKMYRNREHSASSLLGAPFPALGEKEKIWRGITRISEEPWIKDHVIGTSNLFPAAGFIAMVLEAADQVAEQGRVVRNFKLKDIQITAPAVMSEDFDTEFVLQFSPYQTGTRDSSATFTRFVISSSSNGQEIRQNCSGLVLTEYQYVEGSDMALEHALEKLDHRDQYRDALQACHHTEEMDAFYHRLAAVGLNYGPAFRGLSDICSGEGFCCSTITVSNVGLPDGTESRRPNIIHPTTLDIMFHGLFAAFGSPTDKLSSAMVPKSMNEVIVMANTDFSIGTKYKCLAQTSRQGFRETISDLVIMDSHLLGPVVSVTGICCAALSAASEDSKEEPILTQKRIFSQAVSKPFVFQTRHDSNTSPSKSTQIVNDNSDRSSPNRSERASDRVIEDTDELPISPHTEFTILESSHPTEFSQLLCTKLTAELKSKHMKVSRRRWDSNAHDLTGTHCISTVELDDDVLFDATEDDFGTFKSLTLHSSSLMWISNAGDPAGSLSAGIMRSVRNEIPTTNLRSVRISAGAIDHPDRVAALIGRLLVTSTTDTEFVEEDGVLNVCRIVEDESMNEKMSQWMTQREKSIEEHPLKGAQKPLKLAIGAQGMFDTLFLATDDEAERPMKSDEVEIQVQATGMNFRDIMVAMGQIPDSTLGFEASGTILQVGSEVAGLVPGNRVCVLGEGAHRAILRTKADFCMPIPPDITCEEAATVPLVHATAYYALIHIARIRRGQSILIHAAAGGVGQAALQIANHLGLKVFATVGSKHKKTLIHEEYNVPYEHIFNSRDLSFAKGVMRVTGGRGVDCILNSLAGEALRQTWHCIAPFGSFVEIGLKDILSNTGLEMGPFVQDASFTFINLQHLMTGNPDLLARILRAVSDFHHRGILKLARPVTVYPISDMEDAFRLMQMGKHVGKVALSWGSNDVVPQTRMYQPGPPASLSSTASYLLVGGLGGLGRSLASLLVSLGARHLCFISRSGATSSEAKELLRTMTSLQVDVAVYQCDIADSADLGAVFEKHSLDHPPIKGAFQCAMALHDSMFETMTHDQWTASLRPKVLGTYNLDMLLPEDLDFFIILSSFAGTFGNRAQSNYAAANTYQDALAVQRRKLGLKAVTVNLGIMRDIGVLAEQGATGHLKEWEIPFGIRERNFHSLMRMIMASEIDEQGPGVPTQIITGLPTGGTVLNAGIERPFFFDDPRFSELASVGLSSVHEGSPSRAKAAPSKTVATLQSLIAEADS